MAHSNNRYRREMYSLLSWHMHRTDLSPRCTLKRFIQSASGFDIKDADVLVKPERVSLERLLSIRNSMHYGSSPANKKAPLILFGEGENMYLLDGQNRINKAVNESLASMKCLVVRLK